MLSNLAAALITHGRIETTLTKAKTLRPFIEKVISKAKRAAAKTEAKDAIHLRRLAPAGRPRRGCGHAALQREAQGVCHPERRLHPHLQARAPELSDAAEMALIEFVKADDPGYKKSKGRKAGKAKKAAASPPRPRQRRPRRKPRRSRRPRRPPRNPRVEDQAAAPCDQPARRSPLRRVFHWACSPIRSPPSSTARWSALVFLALWLYYDRRDHERFERERRKSDLPLHPLRPPVHRPSGAGWAPARAATMRIHACAFEAAAKIALARPAGMKFLDFHGPDHRRPRFRFAVHPGDRAPRAGVPGLLEDLPLRDAGRTAAGGRGHRDHPLRAAPARSSPPTRRCPIRASSNSACRSWASATASS